MHLIRNSARVLLNVHPPVGRAVWKAYYALRPKARVYQHAIMDATAKGVFDTIYATNDWKDPESRSGPGSTMEYTENLRRELPRLVARLDVHSILDAPCGDFNWMRTVAFPSGVDYLGGDIVESMIAELSARFASPKRRFVPLDIIAGPLPAADLWICRDALFHFPEQEILRVLDNFRGSDILYLLTTNYNFAKVNRDVNLGGFRYINLRRPPFDLPRPLTEIDDFPVLNPPRVMALWSRDQLRGMA